MSEFERAVEWAGGTQRHLADRLGVSGAAITKWRQHGIPPRRAVEIERLSKGSLRAVDLMTPRPARPVA